MDNENDIPRQEKQSNNPLSIIGPGVITGAADDDPSGIATYSQTGAKYGFGLLWTAVFMLPMMYVIQEMAARIGLVTGKGLAKNMRLHYPKILLYSIVGLLLVANVINLGADLGAMAAATQLLIPGNFIFLTVGFTILILLLEIFTSYKKYAKILKWLTISLFAYILTGLLIQSNWGQIIKASIIPHIELNFSFLFLVVGVLGTTISPYMMFWQANEEVEEELSDKTIPRAGAIPHINLHKIGKMRLDTFLGMLFSEITTWFIIVTTAGTLHANGITNIVTASQAAQALEPLVRTFPYAGLIAKGLFAAGIIGTGLLAVPIFAATSSYAVCEIFNWDEGLNKKFNQARSFYIIILVATLVGLSINLLGINPIKALVYTAVINGIISVPIIGVLILMSNSQKIMGSYTSKWLTNTIAIITFIVMALAGIGIIFTFFGGSF